MLLVVYGKTLRLSTKTEVPYWAYKLKKYLPRRRNFKNEARRVLHLYRMRIFVAQRHFAV